MEITKTQTVRIQKLTRENWDEALALQLSKEQESLTRQVTYHIAKAYIMPAGKVNTPFTLYHKDTLVGFFTLEFGRKKYELQAFRIDQSRQNKGLGKAAFEAVIAMIQGEYPLCKMLNISILEGNKHAMRFALRMGMNEVEAQTEGRIVYQIKC